MRFILRFLGLLLVGREGVDSVERFSQAAKQRQQLALEMARRERALRGKTTADDSRKALLEEAMATQARVDRSLDDKTRQDIQNAAARIMTNKAGGKAG